MRCDNIIQYITNMLEYLIVENRLDAARCFQEKSSRSIFEELMILFSKGHRQRFMELFSLLRKQSKLEFYLRVYFLIFTIHPTLKGKPAIPESQISAFKEYIDNKGAQLAKTNQFLEFYALPYIKKPLQSAAFKSLFKKQWVNNLKEKLKIFLLQEEKRIKYQTSKLFEGSIKSSKGHEESPYDEKVKSMELINKKLFEEVNSFKQKYQFLEQSHKTMIQEFHSYMMESQSKWFHIVKELVGCSKCLINMSIKSQSIFINDRKFIKIRKRTEKYQKFVNKKFDDLMSQSQDISIFEKASVNELSSYTVTQKSKTAIKVDITGLNNIDEYIPTDFQQMKKIFWRKDNSEKITILNGLFWRIIKCKDLKSRRMNIIGILIHDLLGIELGNIDQLLASRQLMKPTLRLLNALAMDKYARSVIFTNTNIFRDILALVTSCDDVSLKYIIIMIEYLSAENSLKSNLLSNDIINILVNLLRNDKISKNEVIVENIVATLLNLTSKEEALKQFRKQNQIYTILKRFLETDFMITKVISFAIIYSLLDDEYLFNLAHKAKLPQFINQLHNRNPEANPKQIKPILEKLQHFEPRINKRTQELESLISEEQQDLYECEIDQENIEDYMKDHEEVSKKYNLKGKQGKKQLSSVKQAYDHFNSRKQIKTYEIRNKRKNMITPQYQEFSYQSPKNQGKSTKKNSSFRIKESEERSFSQIENKRLKKSTSNSKIDRKEQRYTSARQKQLKPIDQRNYKSPQHSKKPREQVLKQLNDQLREKRIHSSKKVKREERNQIEEIEGFHSSHKLRRTPPND